MKRVVPILLVALVLAAGAANAAGVGLGVFGGTSIPILQEDSKAGTIFGLRVPVSVVPMLRLEPYWATCTLGDVEETFGGLPYTRDGGKVSAFGLNLTLGTGGPVRFYPLVGIASHRLTREAADDRTAVGYNLGLGLGFSAIPNLDVDVRGEFNMITLDEASRKFANATVGVSYRFLSIP